MLLLFSLLCSIVSAATIIVRVQPTTLLPNPNILPPSTHATITFSDGSVQRSLLRKDNSIVFEEISKVGSHLLNIYSKDYQFAAYRIDTVANPEVAVASTSHERPAAIGISLAAQTYPGAQWSDVGVSLLPYQAGSSQIVKSLTFTPKVLSAKSFYEVRPAFSPLSLLKNPMILMAIAALAFTFGMPKLMENMDPEMRAEYEQMQKKSPTAAIGRAMQGGNTGSDSFDLAGYLAGQGKGNGAENLREKKK